MLGNSTLGYLLLIPSYLSAIIMGIITKNKKREKNSLFLKKSLLKLNLLLT